MRICLYTYTALPKMGGQEVVVDSLARQFLGKGHEVAVLTPFPRRPIPLEDDKYPYRVIRHRRFYSNRYGVGLYRWFLNRLFRRQQFDVLHCHGVYPTGYVGALARNHLRVPMILTAHGGGVYENNPRLHKPGVRKRSVEAVRAADRLIAISPFTKDGYFRLGGDPDKIVSIPNGVAIEPLAAMVRRPANLDRFVSPGKYFLFIGRLKRQKGLDVLLQAMSRLGENARLVVAGEGDHRAEFEALCKHLHLGDRVRFLGQVTGKLKSYLFQNCIATIVPSRLWEAFGLVVIESYAAGRPVIVSRYQGLADLVEENATGFVVDPESPVQLSQAMSYMLSNPQMTEQMGRDAAAAARQYAWDTITDKHIDLYERVLAERQGAAGLCAAAI